MGIGDADGIGMGSQALRPAEIIVGAERRAAERPVVKAHIDALIPQPCQPVDGCNGVVAGFKDVCGCYDPRQNGRHRRFGCGVAGRFGWHNNHLRGRFRFRFFGWLVSGAEKPGEKGNDCHKPGCDFCPKCFHRFNLPTNPDRSDKRCLPSESVQTTPARDGTAV